jgi:hypothetical protein
MIIYQAIERTSTIDNQYMFCINPITWMGDKFLGHFKRNEISLVDSFIGNKILGDENESNW